MSQKNNVKKVTIVEFHPAQRSLEETQEQILEEPSSDYLDVEKLILYLVKIRKSKRLTELLVSKLFELIKNKAGLQFAREDTDVIINNYISQITCFSETLMELSGEVKKLANWCFAPQPRV